MEQIESNTESRRKLASIQTIDKIEPIENAEKLELGHILGWQAVIEKGKYREKDLVIFCEIDSVLPPLPEFLFLEPRKYRIRTIRLRGTLSQGLVWPVSYLLDKGISVALGDDVTEAMGIKKYEIPIPAQLAGKVKGAFPAFLAKTDEPRVQLLQHVLDRYVGTACYVSEKVDGCLFYRTKIHTDMGDIEIGRIVNQRMPVNILTYNETTGKTEFKSILNYHGYHSDKNILTIGVGHRGKGNRQKYITCTDNHMFFTGNGYMEANRLKVGDSVYHYSDMLAIEEEQIILGTLLGDGSIRTENNCTFFNFTHSIVQTEYFDYKMKILGNVIIETKGQRGGFSGSKKNRRAYSISNLKIKSLIEENCLKNGRKTVTRKWLDRLTPLALAIWYMDDGSISHRNSDKQKPRCKINSQGFSYEENLLMQKAFKRFGIDATIGERKVYKGNVLLFDKDNTDKLAFLISPYVCKSMKYKLPRKYESLPCVLEGFAPEKIGGIIETKILSIQTGFKDYDKLYSKWVYDITVKDNHNYFAYNILTHNSSATYYLKDEQFGVCSRNLELIETPENSFWMFARQIKLEEKMKAYSEAHKMNISVQGELIGNGVQKNALQLKDKRILFFNVFDIDKFRYLDYYDFLSACHEMELTTVPIVSEHFHLTNDIPKLVEYATAKSAINPNVWREGIVIRPLNEIIDMAMAQGFGNGRLSIKVINPEYLLKFEG